MSEHPAIYKITDKNVDAYEAYRDKLPCFAKFCAVTPLCFSERQATKRAKYLRYTVKFRDLCAEAFLIMHFIDMLPKVESDLEVSIKEMDKMPIDELFEESIYYFEGDLHDNSKALWTPYFMLIKVIEKDPNFVDDYGENPYYYLGKIYSEIFGENTFVTNSFESSIKIEPS